MDTVWLWLLCYVQCHLLEHAFLCLASLVHLKCGLADSQIECTSFCFSLSLSVYCVCVCASVDAVCVHVCACVCVSSMHSPPSPTCTCLLSLHVSVLSNRAPIPHLWCSGILLVLFVCKKHCLLTYVLTNLEYNLFLCHVIAAH